MTSVRPDPIAWRRSSSSESGHVSRSHPWVQSIAVRNSESPEGPVLTCTSQQCEVVVAAVKDGTFDGKP